MRSAILAARDLSAYYLGRRSLLGGQRAEVQALDKVRLELYPETVLAVVGESGCGKTTLGKALVGLVPGIRGSLLYQGQAYQPRSASPQIRRRIQMIFQDPYGSLNPRLRVDQTILEVLQFYNREDPPDRLSELLEAVQLPPATAMKYPHELSGGQRQRVCIARALAVEPQVLICDEIVSALDVSVQAKILNLIRDLVRVHHLALLFTTHDLQVVQAFADQVLVMYLGQVVEEGLREAIFSTPRHPYTQALLSSRPGGGVEPVPEVGARPDLGNRPSGCVYHPRCQVWQSDPGQEDWNCELQPPPWRRVTGTHGCRCHAVAVARE